MRDQICQAVGPGCYRQVARRMEKCNDDTIGLEKRQQRANDHVRDVSQHFAVSMLIYLKHYKSKN